MVILFMYAYYGLMKTAHVWCIFWTVLQNFVEFTVMIDCECEKFFNHFLCIVQLCTADICLFSFKKENKTIF